MEKFTCIQCKELLEYHKFSKTQQKLSRKTQNGKCISCVEIQENKKSIQKPIKNNNFIQHPDIPGLYNLPVVKKEAIDAILNALKSVKWTKSICRSTYSCGWEWVNYGGGKLTNWRSPTKELADALSLLEVPKLNINRGDFNQIIFTKYRQHRYVCSKCKKTLSALQFPRNENQVTYTCYSCIHSNQPKQNIEYEGMAAHVDRYELGPIVWGMTIQGSGFMRFTRHRNDKNYIDVPASEGMCYCMTEGSRYNWAHQPYGEDRISITIRAVPCKSPKIKELGFNE